MGLGTTSASMVVPPLLQQESLILVFVALGIGIIGMGFGKIRNKDSFQMHRWIMTGAIALNFVAILIVMLPSLVFFYIDPNVTIASPFSILQIIHAVVGVPAFTMAMIFAFNDLPRQTKKWMVLTAVLWLTSIALGAVVYFTMPN